MQHVTTRNVTCLAGLAIIVFALCGAPVCAFDASAHFDLTRDALAAEGFGETAIQVVQVTNWMCDFYEQASQNPYSGHADPGRAFLGGLIAGGATPIVFENWPDSAVRAAKFLGFDSETRPLSDRGERGLDSGEMCEVEWTRLARATRAAARDCAARGDSLGVLTALGISLHHLQDFYVHTNWVEPSGVAGYDGPGWAQVGTYGSHPTWFDVPLEVRRAARVYSCGGGPGLRTHGYWDSDGNFNLATALNKDWPGRPYYTEAYITAYFATRQWARALRTWVGNDAAWRAAQTFSNRHGDQLDHDLNGAFNIQFNAGHWQGQGEPALGDAPGPGGSLDDLAKVLVLYHARGRTVFRQRFEEVVPAIAALNPPPGDTPVQPSGPIQGTLDFISLKVTRVADATPWYEVGIDPGIDEADFYARANIAGQEFVSGMIHGYDSYGFPAPSYPFTFIKAVPLAWRVDEPVTTLQVEVRTGDVQWGGTDDDVYLRINDRTRFLLDKPLYDDFERGDVDTYSLDPPRGLRVRDIEYIQIEKSEDGAAGGWRLSRVRVFVNGEQVYYRDRIDKWLEDDDRRWRAPDFVPRAPMTNEVPVTLRLYDSDGNFYLFGIIPVGYGADDHCDIHPDFNRYDLNLLFNRDRAAFRGDVSGAASAVSSGGSNHGGRWPDGEDNDRCDIAFAIERLRVTPPPLATAVGPRLEIARFAPPAPVVSDDGAWTCDTDSLHASWHVPPAVNSPPALEYQYAVHDNTRNMLLVKDWTSAGRAQTADIAVSLTDGHEYVIQVRARNEIGWSPIGASDGIGVDLERPRVGITSFLQTRAEPLGPSREDHAIIYPNSFRAALTGTDGGRSGFDAYLVGITEEMTLRAGGGETPRERAAALPARQTSTVLSAIEVKAEDTRDGVVVIRDVPGLYAGRTYTLKVKGRDHAGNLSEEATATCVVRFADTTPPPAPQPRVVSVNPLTIAWDEVYDAESGIAEYQVAVASDPSLAERPDLIAWQSVGRALQFSQAKVTLPRRWCAWVKAVNGTRQESTGAVVPAPTLVPRPKVLAPAPKMPKMR